MNFQFIEYKKNNYSSQIKNKYLFRLMRSCNTVIMIQYICNQKFIEIPSKKKNSTDISSYYFLNFFKTIIAEILLHLIF